jgi:hypothetical protein
MLGVQWSAAVRRRVYIVVRSPVGNKGSQPCDTWALVVARSTSRLDELTRPIGKDVRLAGRGYETDHHTSPTCKRAKILYAILQLR